MAPNEQARRNHAELFPGHVSTLAATDPELVEIFDNCAFDEVLRRGNLDVRTRPMGQLASMIAAQARAEDRVMAGAALTVGATPIEIKEIVYQAVPYVGMAKVFVALGGCEPRVNGHVAANLNVGNDRARLIDVLTQLLPFIGYPRTLNALRVVDEVTAS